jgi:ATP-dependent exoDNAse (exonuclease V) beta subunit
VLKQNQFIKEAGGLDNVNVLYVALTRAEEQLYFKYEFVQKGEVPKIICTFFYQLFDE